MASFMIRVVLHRADGADYTDLHDAMAEIGCQRSIVGKDGVAYDLPNAEYVLEGAYEATNVRDAVHLIAKQVQPHPGPSVLVTKWSHAAWVLKPEPGVS